MKRTVWLLLLTGLAADALAMSKQVNAVRASCALGAVISRDDLAFCRLSQDLPVSLEGQQGISSALLLNRTEQKDFSLSCQIRDPSLSFNVPTSVNTAMYSYLPLYCWLFAADEKLFYELVVRQARIVNPP